jgi:hypothetical protein
VPPEETPIEEVPTMVPVLLTERSCEVMPASVVEPMLLIENKVVVPVPFDDEPIAKRVLVFERRRPVVVDTKIERGAKGEVVPMPTLPPWIMNCVVVAPVSDEEAMTNDGVAGD